jgi:uracil-DNA glycosylase
MEQFEKDVQDLCDSIERISQNPQLKPQNRAFVAFVQRKLKAEITVFSAAPSNPGVHQQWERRFD